MPSLDWIERQKAKTAPFAGASSIPRLWVEFLFVVREIFLSHCASSCSLFTLSYFPLLLFVFCLFPCYQNYFLLRSWTKRKSKLPKSSRVKSILSTSNLQLFSNAESRKRRSDSSLSDPSRRPSAPNSNKPCARRTSHSSWIRWRTFPRVWSVSSQHRHSGRSISFFSVSFTILYNVNETLASKPMNHLATTWDQTMSICFMAVRMTNNKWLSQKSKCVATTLATELARVKLWWRLLILSNLWMLRRSRSTTKMKM